MATPMTPVEIKAQIRANIFTSPAALPRSNTAESVALALENLVDSLTLNTWSPILAAITDGNRIVWQVSDWFGGFGTKPDTGQYIGSTGFVTLIADAINVRGVTGWSPIYALETSGERRVQKIVDWTGGEGTKPATGQYIGPTGLVATAAEATDLRGATGLQGPAGTIGSSTIPVRTTPINRATEKTLIQRADGVVEKVTLFQLAGGQPLVTGNLVANGNTEFGDLSNIVAGDMAKLTFDITQAPPAGGAGAFKYTGANGYARTLDLIPVNLLRKHRFSFLARSGDANGANYDAAGRFFMGFVCYDADGQMILPQHFGKVTGSAQTTLAAALNPGQTTVTLTSATGWHNGATPANRNFAWYPYTTALGSKFEDYGYTRNVSSNYAAYTQANGGAWASGGISGNVITLRSAWTGPALPAGTKIANVFEGNTYMYGAALNYTAIPNAWTVYETTVQGVNATSTEDPNNLQFRPGTAYIRPIILINNGAAGTATFYFTMFDFREITGSDPATLLAANNPFTGNNSFAGSSAFTGDVSVRRIAATGSAPSVTGGVGAGAGCTISIVAGSTDMAGTLSILTASGAAGNQLIANITFNIALAAAPKAVILTARNNQAGMSMTRWYVNLKTATGWTLNSTDVTLSASTTYLLDYVVIA